MSHRQDDVIPKVKWTISQTCHTIRLVFLEPAWLLYSCGDHRMPAMEIIPDCSLSDKIMRKPWAQVAGIVSMPWCDMFFFFLASHLKPSAPCCANVLFASACKLTFALIIDLVIQFVYALRYITPAPVMIYNIAGPLSGPVRPLKNECSNPSKHMCDMRVCPAFRAAKAMLLNICDCCAQSMGWASMYQPFLASLYFKVDGHSNLLHYLQFFW